MGKYTSVLLQRFNLFEIISIWICLCSSNFSKNRIKLVLHKFPVNLVPIMKFCPIFWRFVSNFKSFVPILKLYSHYSVPFSGHVLRSIAHKTFLLPKTGIKQGQTVQLHRLQIATFWEIYIYIPIGTSQKSSFFSGQALTPPPS